MRGAGERRQGSGSCARRVRSSGSSVWIGWSWAGAAGGAARALRSDARFRLPFDAAAGFDAFQPTSAYVSATSVPATYFTSATPDATLDASAPLDAEDVAVADAASEADAPAPPDVCDELGLARTPRRTEGFGTNLGEVAGDFTVHTVRERLGDRDPWAELMPEPQELPADLLAEGHAIPVARVQAMHEGKRRKRARETSGEA